MLRRNMIAAAALVAGSLGPALAEECRPAESEERLNLALEGDVISGFREFGGMPAIVLRPSTWQALDERTKLGMVAELECFIAGPGERLVGVRFVSEGGQVLATFDGALRRWADD